MTFCECQSVHQGGFLLKETILALWNGKLYPAETSGRGNKEMMRLSAEKERLFERLEGMLGEKAQAVLADYADCVQQYMNILEEQAFVDGYSLGARMTAEALLNTEERGRKGNDVQ